VLHSGLGVMLAVAGTETSSQAFFLGSAALALILLTSLVSALAYELLQKRTPLWLLVALASLAIALGRRLFGGRLDELPPMTGILLYLLAVSPVIFARARGMTASTTVGRALFDAAGTGTGLVAVLACLGLARELLSRGTAGSAGPLFQPPAPWMGTMLGGFVSCAAAIALFRLARERSGP